MPSIRRLLTVAAFATATSFPFIFPAQASPSSTIQLTSTLLDINTATPAQLKSLPGMGDAYVCRIINGRPYTAKNQLLTRGVLPEPAYDKISTHIIAKHPAK